MSEHSVSDGVEVPLVLLGGISLSIGRNPLNPEEKMFQIGPIVLGLPFTEDGAKAIVRALTGIQIVGAHEQVH